MFSSFANKVSYTFGSEIVKEIELSSGCNVNLSILNVSSYKIDKLLWKIHWNLTIILLRLSLSSIDQLLSVHH